MRYTFFTLLLFISFNGNAQIETQYKKILRQLYSVIDSLEGKPRVADNAELERYKLKTDSIDHAYKILLRRYRQVLKDNKEYESAMTRANRLIVSQGAALEKREEELGRKNKYIDTLRMDSARKVGTITSQNKRIESIDQTIDNLIKSDSRITKAIPYSKNNEVTIRLATGSTEIFSAPDALTKLKIEGRVLERISRDTRIQDFIDGVCIIYVKDTSYSYIPCRLKKVSQDENVVTYEIDDTLILKTPLPNRTSIKVGIVKQKEHYRIDTASYKSFYSANADGALNIVSLKRVDPEKNKQINSSLCLETLKVDKETVRLSLSDIDDIDGDSIRVYLNGEVFVDIEELKKDPDYWDLKLEQGLNLLSFEILSQGKRAECTVGINLFYKKNSLFGTKNKRLNSVKDFNAYKGQIISFKIFSN